MHSKWLIEFCKALNAIARKDDDTKAIRNRWDSHIQHAEKTGKDPTDTASDIYRKHINSVASKIAKQLKNQ